MRPPGIGSRWKHRGHQRIALVIGIDGASEPRRCEVRYQYEAPAPTARPAARAPYARFMRLPAFLETFTEEPGL